MTSSHTDEDSKSAPMHLHLTLSLQATITSTQNESCGTAHHPHGSSGAPADASGRFSPPARLPWLLHACPQAWEFLIQSPRHPTALYPQYTSEDGRYRNASTLGSSRSSWCAGISAELLPQVLISPLVVRRVSIHAWP